MTKKLWFVSIMIIIMIVGTTEALPEFLDAFNVKYDTKGMMLDNCDICHIRGKPPQSLFSFIPEITIKNKKLFTRQKPNNNLNEYGMLFKKNLTYGVNEALTSIEPLDPDNDKVSNINEINNLTFPGNKTSKLGKPKNKINPLTQVKYVPNISAINNYQPP